MAEPVWDGTGTDPWMPRRLAAQAEAVVGERTVFDDYLARLSRWLVMTRRAVMRSPITDPDAIWALMPAWAESMTEFVHSTIADLIGTAYRKLLGPGYIYSQRPHVTAYLAEAQNRLLNVPNQVYDRIVGEIAEGAGMGEGMPQIAKRVEEMFSLTNTPYWPNRAVVVARTESMAALNAGRSGAFKAVAEELGDPFEQGWLATTVGPAAATTRPTHLAADIGTPITGQRVPVGTPFLVGGFWLDQPGDPSAPINETAQCRCGTVLLRPGEDLDLSDRQMIR